VSESLVTTRFFVVVKYLRAGLDQVLVPGIGAGLSISVPAEASILLFLAADIRYPLAPNHEVYFRLAVSKPVPWRLSKTMKLKYSLGLLCRIWS
jgi:hypothetical protein